MPLAKHISKELKYAFLPKCPYLYLSTAGRFAGVGGGVVQRCHFNPLQKNCLHYLLFEIGCFFIKKEIPFCNK